MWNARLVGFDSKGARAWDVTGDVPEVIARCEYENQWFDARDFDAGGACSRVFGEHIAVGIPTKQGTAEILVLDADLNITSRFTTEARIELWDLAVSPDGEFGAGHLYGDGVVLWEMKEGKTAREFDGHISSAAAYSPDGRYVSALDSGQGGGHFYVLDLHAQHEEDPRREFSHAKARQPLFDAAAHAAWSEDGALLAFTSTAWGVHGVVVYDVATMNELWSTRYDMHDPDEEIWDALELAFTSDGNTLVVGVEREIKAFDARSGTPRASLKGYGEDVPPYFALDGTHRRIWTTREKSPVSHAWPDDW